MARPLPAFVRRDHGFSLVELLVAIAILAVLIGLLVPALSSASRRGLVTKDKSQLRQLQVAHLAYATDHNGAFIDVGLTHGALPDQDIAWINTLEAYYQTVAVLQSPLDASPHWPSGEGGRGVPIEGTTDRFRRTSYGCNNFLSRSLSPSVALEGPRAATDTLSRVKNHAATIHFLHMAAEGEFAGADHVHVESWWVSDALPDIAPVSAAAELQTNVVDGEARGWDARANYGFLDGHVETLAFSEAFQSPAINRFDPAVASTTLLRNQNP